MADCVSIGEDIVHSRPVGDLRHLLALTADAVLEWDCNLKLTTIHGRVEGLIWADGIRLDALEDVQAPPGDWPRLRAALEQHRSFRQCRCPVLMGDGKRLWMLLSGVPVTDQAGTFSGYVTSACAADDIDRRADSERRRQRLEGLGLLAGGIAHAFNNLLLPVTMLARLGLGRTEKPDDVLHQYLTIIHDSGWKAASLVRTLLDHARHAGPVAEAVVVGTEVEQRLEMLRQAMPPSLALTWSVADRTSRVRANINELSQIVVNLVQNASEAMDETGTVHCCVDSLFLSPKEMKQMGFSQSHLVRFSVGDDGPGMPAPALEQAMTPFYTTAFPRRSGMGLTIVNDIVRDWGGRLSLASSPGKGAVATVLLPVDEGACPSP